MRPRPSFAVVACFLFLPLAAAAQNHRPPRADLYTGISYSNISVAGLGDRKNAIGWSADLTLNANRFFGVSFDFGGQYDPKCPENDTQCFVEKILANEIQQYSAYQFMAGPRFNVPTDRFNIFFHALVGGVRTRARIINVASRTATITTSGPNLAMAFGGGLEWKVADRFAVRLVQVDYIPVRESPTWRRNVRIQGGIVLRF